MRRKECDCLSSRTLKTASRTKAFDRSSRPRTWLDESGATICNSYRIEGHTPITNTRGSTRADKWQFCTHFLYMVSLKDHLFARQLFHLSSSLLQMTIVLHPSRIRHNGDTGADVQKGPAPRILFRLRPCINLFYCLLLVHIPRILSTIEKDADVLACGYARPMHVPGHKGLLTKDII